MAKEKQEKKSEAGARPFAGAEGEVKRKPTLKEVEERLGALQAEIDAKSPPAPAAAAPPAPVVSAKSPANSATPAGASINIYLFWGMLLCSILFSSTPYVSWLLLPVTQFVTTVHEMCHAVMTWLTGGIVTGMTTVSDGAGHGGLTFHRGGFQLLVGQAGYIGTTLVGCFLIWASQHKAWSKHILTALGAIVLAGALAFTLPGLFSVGLFMQSLLSLVIEIAMGVAFLFAGRKLNATLANLTVLFLAVQTTLSSLSLIWILVPHALGLAGHGFSDATSMQQATMVPAVVWALWWMSFSLVSFLVTLRFTYGSFVFSGISKIKTAYVKPKNRT